jgi:hypothetical protein
MCPDCSTKDYCECYKAHSKALKLQARNRAVNATLTALKKHRVPYTQTGLTNVVSIPLAKQSKVLLSLKSTKDDDGKTTYKYRLNNTSKWSEIHRDKFYTWLRPLLSNASPASTALPAGDLMPFGKYRGQPLATVVETDESYFKWVLGKCRISLTLFDSITALLN